MTTDPEMLPDEVDDCALVRQALAEREAFAALFDRYYRRLYAYAAARVYVREDAEDITAEVFQRVILHLGTFRCEHAASFASWLFRIARHEVIRHYERHQRQPVTLPLEDADVAASPGDPNAFMVQQDEAQQLWRAVGQLSPRRQEIITLRFYAELRNHEIAEVLGLDERTVAAHLCRGLDDLQRMLTEQPLKTAERSKP
jgi:RNA polymerase sigma-70 factor (ECF subfamily)